MSHISKNIKYLRKRRGQSQEKLAKSLDMSRGNIASYEGGKALPSAEKLLRLANYFNVDIGDMIHEDLEEVMGNSTAQVNGMARTDVEQFRQFLSRARKILDGLKEYHEHKFNGKNELPEVCGHLMYDYERVVGLLEESLKMGEGLLGGIDIDRA